MVLSYFSPANGYFHVFSFSVSVSTASLTWLMIPIFFLLLLIALVGAFFYWKKKHGRYNVDSVFFHTIHIMGTPLPRACVQDRLDISRVERKTIVTQTYF